MAYEHYYSVKAQEMRQLGKSASTDRARDEFHRLALEYEQLAEMAGENRPPLKQA